MKTARFLNSALNNEDFCPLQISLGSPRYPLSYSIEAKLFVIAPTREILLLKNKDEYFDEYIRKLNKHEDSIYRLIDGLKKDNRELVLLCFEDIRNNKQWCHRRMFAEWWEERTGEKVDELFEPPILIKKEEPEAKQTLLF